MRTLFLDSFSGISGDMTLGLLVDLGIPASHLAEAVSPLGLEPIGISARREQRSGITGTRILLDLPPSRHRRVWREIDRLLAEADLDPRDAALARRIFRRIAEAEGAVHGVPAEEVHFHEVGALDALVDIVATAAGLRMLGVDRVVCSPLPMPRGFVTTGHGRFPVPAPATVEILRGLPVAGDPSDTELVTPTGAAIAAETAEFGPWPAMTIDRVGYGVGSRTLADRPNLLRGVLGASAGPPLATDRVAVLESHIDDANPEWLGHLVERLLASGALDAALGPLQMKKGRPGVRLTVVAPPGLTEELARLILLESSAIGVRWHETGRFKLDRRSATVDTPWGEVEVKLLLAGERLLRTAPEYESCRRLAEASGRPLPEIYRAAERAAEQRFGTPEAPPWTG